MHHLYSGAGPNQLQIRFARYVNIIHNMRRINYCVVPQSISNPRAMCLTIYGAKLLNSLDDNLKFKILYSNLNAFKKNLINQTYISRY